MIRIALRNRQREIVSYTVVDDDMSHLADKTWHLLIGRYVVRNATKSERAAGIPSHVYMHREVLDVVCGNGMEVDHINRETLDNRRENLRLGTPAQNQQNLASRAVRSCSSSYRGVSFIKTSGKWRAETTLNGKHHHLGNFQLEEDAARAAADFRAQHMPWSEEARMVGSRLHEP